jgi:hypothetical protein
MSRGNFQKDSRASTLAAGQVLLVTGDGRLVRELLGRAWGQGLGFRV